MNDASLGIGLIVGNARGQSFEEIVVMMGCKASVAKEFKVFNLKVLAIPCSRHALNPAAKDLIRNVKEMTL